ncbi:hypothetical protein ABW19_dt0201393 [Dactylella cylindrospora]|nr:hypothetical protein ABW19_dt0201393 [Dactylella cylindrospora]
MLRAVVITLCILGAANALIPKDKYTKRQALRERLFEGIPATVDIKWYPCNETSEVEYECARLLLPLDYQEPENDLKAIIPLVKYPAKKGVPYKGWLLTNPGGPGGLGSEFIYDVGIATAIENAVVGPGWDIIGFDPRGIGYAVPYGSCDILSGTFEPDRQNATVFPAPSPKSKRQRLSTTPTHNDEVSYGVLIPDDPPSWISLAYDSGDLINYQCQGYVAGYNQAGPHMNTVVVATDMLNIGKALARWKKQPEDNVLVNYYGISYGTVLGQYFATLYPNNVGKFLLDAVVDVSTWVSQNETETAVIHADKAWSKFFTTCANAGPSNCSFHTGRNSHAIRERFNRLSAKLNATKYELEDHPATLVVSQVLQGLKSSIFNSIYSAYFSWPFLADFFVTVEPLIAPADPSDWDFDAILQAYYDYLMTQGSTDTPVFTIPESFTQVACTDARDIRGFRITAEEIAAWKRASKIGGFGRIVSKIGCSRWDIRPSWEWDEPIGGNTKTPILFAGNSLDPITPFENAEKARTLFKGAKMIYVDEIGHSILNTRNTCAFAKAVAYFQNGTLPDHNNRCKGEVPPFQ